MRTTLQLLAAYQDAMRAFDADALADLYAEDAVHEFGFFTPQHEPRYTSREQVRAAYTRTWAGRGVDIVELHDLAVHEDGATVVSEWAATIRRRDTGEDLPLAGVLILTSADGELTHVRDYMDVLGMLHRTGRLQAVAATL